MNLFIPLFNSNVIALVCFEHGCGLETTTIKNAVRPWAMTAVAVK